MKKTKFLKILISSAIALTVVAVLTPPKLHGNLSERSDSI